MLDIDHFKTINDTWGHPCGDLVIRAVSDVILARTRDKDIAGRLGGEEFGIILPETTVAEAAEIAERIRAGVADDSIEYAGEQIRVTISVGVVVNTDKEKDLSSLISSGDRFLYTAKERGRNRVVAAMN